MIPVLNRVEIDYKTPLRSGDRFVSKLWVERKGARFVFHQDLFKTDTGEAVVSAVVSCVCLSDGKLDRGDMLAEVFKNICVDMSLPGIEQVAFSKSKESRRRPPEPYWRRWAARLSFQNVGAGIG